MGRSVPWVDKMHISSETAQKPGPACARHAGLKAGIQAHLFRCVLLDLASSSTQRIHEVGVEFWAGALAERQELLLREAGDAVPWPKTKNNAAGSATDADAGCITGIIRLDKLWS